MLEELKAVAPVYAVRGNNDRGWAANLGKELEITLFGLRIYMVHNIKHLQKDLSGIDIIVYGHSHKYYLTGLRFYGFPSKSPYLC